MFSMGEWKGGAGYELRNLLFLCETQTISFKFPMVEIYERPLKSHGAGLVMSCVTFRFFVKHKLEFWNFSQSEFMNGP